MARVALRHPANADGPWFVDERCIDCGTCRDLAPSIFGDARDQAIVVEQPSDADGERDAWLAAQACPTSSIGTADRRRRPGRLYPREIEPASGVFDLGYCSPDSFGASAWFLTRPAGNLLVDAPRYTDALVGPLAAAGGVAHVLLTHRDDVADAGRWALRFGARVWIHEADRSAAPFATDILTGDEHVDAELAPGVVAVPVPGHTSGSVVYVVDQRFAFTGDSLAWDHDAGDLEAFRSACWYSWSAQTRSLAALAERHRFCWVLPGHGARVRLEPDEMWSRLVALVERMRSAA
jgi:glyoxylase-like metal-dependent hydrolase (beta-lactamase superfamily II)/ferredoxin